MNGADYGATHRAIVRSIVANGVVVEVPALAPNGAWGPIPTCVPNLAVGEAVLVTQISTSRDTLVVIGRVPGRTPTIAEIVNLATTIANLQAADTALQAAITAGDNALDARLDTAEANLTTLNAHTHTALPSLAVAGALDVDGATTLEALAAATAAIAGAVSAHSAAVFSEQLEAAAHGAWSTKIRAKDATVHNRSARQPVVHHEFAAAVNVTVGTGYTLLDSFAWVQRETGNASLTAVVLGAAFNGFHGSAAQSELRWRLIRVSNGALLAEQAAFYLSSICGDSGVGPITGATLLGTPDVLLTAGLSYRFEIHAREDPAFTHDMFVRDVSWVVTECIRVT